jgi:hypothetical protein
MTRSADGWDWVVGVRRKGKRYRFGVRLAGPQAETWAGPDWLPGAFSPFFLFQSIFYFLKTYFFITFSNWFQIDSNQFVNFPKIQHNILE